MEQKIGRTKEQTALQVSVTTIVSNVLLAVLKLFAGIFAHSAALLSDAVHSLIDVFATLIVIFGVRIGSKEPKGRHVHGHGRPENAAAILLSGVLFLTGAGIGYRGIERILLHAYSTAAVPGVFALVAALLSIGVKEGLFFYIRRAANTIDSTVLMADAWHQRADSLSSVGSLIGIAGARMGFPVLDPAASMLICLFILITALRIFRCAVKKMTEHSIQKSCLFEKESKTACMKQDGLGRMADMSVD